MYFPEKTIELYCFDELCMRCYDSWMDLGAKAIVKDYLYVVSLLRVISAWKEERELKR